MSTEKTGSIVEQTLLQIKAVENAISENAKGILASTMKQEISELVRESLIDSKQTKKSLNEQEVPQMDEPEADVPMGDEEEVNVDVEDEGGEPEANLGFDMDIEGGEDEGDNEMEMPPLDLTSASPEEVLKVFKAMGDEDGIIVKKEDDFIHLIDDEDEYLIQAGDMDDNTEEPMLDLEEGVIYEIEVEEDYMEEGDYNMEEGDYHMEEGDYHMEEGDYHMEEGDYHMEEGDYHMEEGDYHMEEGEDFLDLDSIPMDDFSNMKEEQVYEIDEEELNSVVEAFKAVGMGMGKAGSGMAKTSVNNKGFKEDQPQGTKGVGMGKADKFKYPKIKHGVTETEVEETFEGWEQEEDVDVVDIEKTEGMMEPETTEASRTMTYRRRAERDRVAAPSQLRKESVNNELNLLQEKNEEYKKALNFFRTKLNEVAVFNSNLAYATRLFTEHSTTKQEKINILRRFDNVESIKESKNLYKSIKNELDGKGTEVVTESVQTKVNKTPANGSSTNLIESKTYENPQFMRMRDLMTKIK
jgi:hypothetical protein